MIDLSKIKNITIAEGSVTKITDSSGVVLWQKVVAPSSSLDVDLNNQWIASTKTLDGYNVYMSNSNHNVDNGYASMKFKFKGMPNFKLWINSYAESNYDYTIAWDMDKDYPTSNPSYSLPGAKASTNGKQYNPTNITAFTEVDYSNDGGEHFVVVTFRKDGSVNNNDDRGYVAVKLTLLSTTWVVSATEFVKKDDKYYQRLNEVGTYEGGVTANTGNYKEGNELPVTYKQGSADDYIVNDGKLYYKKYAYVTPKDQEINTGDYIQGDYIGEATPSMKVTYNDGSNKTFYNLTSIDQNTDSNKANAKSVEIYDSVTSIGEYAFTNCSSLTSITIPNSVTSIGEYAFYNCSKLTDITIPSGVTIIGKRAFQACSSLTSVTIPDSVTIIYDDAFSNCSSLTGITIPNSVTDIREGAFYECSSLASVTIQNSNNKLAFGKAAFHNISPNAKLFVPSNLLSDYQSDSNWTGAFKGGIFAITPSMKVTYNDGTEKTFYNLTIIEQDTDPNKVNTKSVEIYDGVTIIDNDAFLACSSLTGITIPNSVTDIREGAFYDCSSLESVTIQNSNNKLAFGKAAFHNISPNAKLFVPSNLLAEYQADTVWTYTFKGGIYAIPSSMKVTYNDGTEKTFYNLTSIEYNTDPNKVNAKNVEIYDGVTIIDDDAFRACSNLTSITIPNSVTRIGEWAFYACSNLTGITIPDGVTSIGKMAFEDCSSLTDITIPDSVTSIGEAAFFNCSNLTDITIPNSVTSIGETAFKYCNSLATVVIENSTSKLEYNIDAFANIPSTAILYVPASVLSDYQSDSNWTEAFKGGIFAIGS